MTTGYGSDGEKTRRRIWAHVVESRAADQGLCSMPSDRIGGIDAMSGSDKAVRWRWRAMHAICGRKLR